MIQLENDWCSILINGQIKKSNSIDITLDNITDSFRFSYVLNNIPFAFIFHLIYL